MRGDGHVPECETPEGCRVPPPGAEGAQVLEMRSLVHDLRGLMSPEGVLMMLGARLSDLRLLAAIERVLGEDA
jgi:hypothetical protein